MDLRLWGKAVLEKIIELLSFLNYYPRSGGGFSAEGSSGFSSASIVIVYCDKRVERELINNYKGISLNPPR